MPLSSIPHLYHSFGVHQGYTLASWQPGYTGDSLSMPCIACDGCTCSNIPDQNRPIFACRNNLLCIRRPVYTRDTARTWMSCVGNEPGSCDSIPNLYLSTHGRRGNPVVNG